VCPKYRLGDCGVPLFSVLGRKFQLVTVCHQFTPLIAQALFELVPVLPRNGGVRLPCEDADDIDDREKPCFRGFVVHTAYRLILEQSGLGGDGHGQRLTHKPDVERAFLRCLPFRSSAASKESAKGGDKLSPSFRNLPSLDKILAERAVRLAAHVFICLLRPSAAHAVLCPA
jgi:hypothetical protein